jgi:hypothetical protein
MGHREAAKRALTTYDTLSGLTVIATGTAIVSGYLVFKHHGDVRVLAGALIAMFVLLRLRTAAGRRMKHHFDHVNMSNLIGNWGGMRSRKRRERAARIIGRH